MNTRVIDCSSRLAFILAILVGLALLGPNAVANRLTLLDPPADDKPRITHFLAEPDGGFTVVLSSGQGQTFDAAGALMRQFSSRWLATDLFTSSLGDDALRVGDRLVLVRSQAISLPDQEFESEAGWLPACKVENLAAGGQVQVLFRSRMQGWSAVASEADGAGGLWVRKPQDDELHRYAADCSFRKISDVPEDIEYIAAHPQLKAAFLVTRSGQLSMVDEQGVRWTRPLPGFDSHSRFVLPTLSALDSGQVLVPYVAGNFDPRLAAFSDSGQLLWTMSLQDDPESISSFAHGILIGSLNSLSGQFETRLIDASGSVQWSVPVWILSTMQPINRAQTQAASFVARAGADWPEPDFEHIITIDLQSGDWRVTEIARQNRVMATLGNGDLIIGDLSDESGALEPARLVRVMAESAPQPLTLSDVLVLEQVHGSSSDGLGALLVSGGEGHTTLHLIDSQQQPQFSYRIPGSSREQNHWFLGSALNDHLACVLFERGFWGNEPTKTELHCIDRQSGEPVFAPVLVEGQSMSLRPQIGDYIEIFRTVQGSPPVLKRLRISLSGTVLTDDKPFPAPFNVLSSVQSKAFLDTGHTVFFTENATLILAPDSEPEQWLGVIDGLSTDSSAIRGDLSSAVVHQNRLGLIGFRRSTGQHRLVEFDLNSKEINWSINIPWGDTSSRVLTRADDSWVVSDISNVDPNAGIGNERALFVRVFDKEGDLRHSHQRAVDQRLYSRMRIAGAGHQIALQTHLSGATQVEWIDIFSGRLKATTTLPIGHDYRIVSESLPSGRVLISGRSHGATYPHLAVSRASAHSRPRKTDVQTSRWAGAWFNLALNGQGFFIDPMEEQDQIFAAWFTFESSAKPNQRGLRWYTGLGPTPGADGVSVLTLYENRDGVFDQGPITEANKIGTMRLWETMAGDLVAELQIDEQEHDLSFELTRLSPATSFDGARTWFNPASSGQGLLLSSTIADPGPLAFGWFTFDPIDVPSSKTRQHWFLGITDEDSAQGDGREATLYRTLGGINALQATTNTQAIGRASLRSIDCTTARIEYQFDESDLAAEFAGLSGTTTLVSVRGCL